MGKGSGGVSVGQPSFAQAPVSNASMLPQDVGTSMNLGQAGTNVSGQAAAESATPFQQQLPQGSFGQMLLPALLGAMIHAGQQSQGGGGGPQLNPFNGGQGLPTQGNPFAAGAAPPSAAFQPPPGGMPPAGPQPGSPQAAPPGPAGAR